MNIILRKSLLVCASTLFPLSVFAGDIDVVSQSFPSRVDIPNITPGWGVYLEGAFLRGFNNDLSFAFYQSALSPEEYTVASINTDLNFQLRIGADYTLPDAANVIKVSYEHLFYEPYKKTGLDVFSNIFEGQVKIKLGAVSLLSEQHFLLGPYIETMLSGGLRFARIEQEFKNHFISPTNITRFGMSELGYKTNVGFFGLGPLFGAGSQFHVTENFALGVQALTAIMLGHNDFDFSADYYVSDLKTPNKMSLVPEISTRLYGNYFYRYSNGMELQVELGWRLDQYFNLQTRYAEDAIADIALAGTDFSTPLTISDEIGFSGPYLSAHIKL